jgi:uncharacterized protein YfaT (DUF1175 family)
MYEMVDRVAQVIRESDPSDSVDCEAVARAVIEAMRDPTDDMLRAWFAAIDRSAARPDPEAPWHALIDAALK